MQQQQGEMRLRAWELFMRAALERPWFGFGWTETNTAQIEVLGKFPGLGSIFSSSHNLFVDLVIWIGIPLGLLTIGILFHWFWTRVWAVRQAEDAIMLMVLGAVGIHAALEYPLKYAYFLLPTGLVMGMLNVRLGGSGILSVRRWFPASLLATAVLATVVTVRDYKRVEASYTLLRLEQGLLGMNKPPLGGPPDVWVLTHLREWIRLARFKPHQNMSEQELDDLDKITRFYPSMGSAYRLATSLALNGQTDAARQWLAKICGFTDKQECDLAKRTWEREAPGNPQTAKIAWPGKTTH